MTALELQKTLAVEVEDILKDIICKTENGEKRRVRAFLQKLPKRIQELTAGEAQEDEGEMPEDGIMEPEEDEKAYPYCIVRVDSGELKTLQSTNKVKVTLIFGIFDDDRACEGHQVILNMIQRIMVRFTENPVLNARFRMDDGEGITWVLDDGEAHPYYFGAMTMTWDTFFVRREDRYA